MKIADIEFPTPLLNALRDGKLVIFAGAGVSRGEPACLPDFKSLANTIAKGTGKSLEDAEPDDFLGKLQDDEVKVHARAAEELSGEYLKATELHWNLLRLYPDVGTVRVVTTNFDLLFEQAAGILKVKPEVFRAPALPLGDQFNGIVHVHGAVSHPDDMVITDKDFGRAYINEGWAQRFLVKLFSNFTILFIGYRHKDRIMNYLTRALQPRETNPRFALTPENETAPDRWHTLGIQPINYPQPNEDDPHSELNKGIRELAKFFQRSIRDWHRKITEIARKPPPRDTDKETVDLIEYALGDETQTRFFTKAASDPKWIDWLDERDQLEALFGDRALNEQDKLLSWWLAEQFRHNHADKLFLLIGKHNTRLHPHFWHNLGYRIGTDKETSWNQRILPRWISLLLATIQKPVGTNNRRPVDTSRILQWLGERCIEHGMLDSLLQIFDAMIESNLQLKQGFFWPNGDENNESPPVNAELSLICKPFPLNELWQKGLKPKLPQVAERLLDRVIKHLEDREITLRAWQEENRKWDSEIHSCWTIKPPKNTRSPRAANVLIEVVRDCLEWLVSNQVETATLWCDRYVCSDVPLLRLLAVHGVSKREDLTADDKIDWLLTHTELHESPIHPEVFQVLQQVYPKASPERREDLIKAVRAYCWPNKENPDGETTARQHFEWFHWLHESDPNCSRAKQALDAVLAKYPEFKPSEPPDLTHRSRSGQSPSSPEELLAKPAADWLDDLLLLWDRSDYSELKENVAKATRQNFDWSLDLAEALDKAKEWNADLWSTLIYAWSTMALGEDRHRKVLSWLGKTELYPKHNSEIAKVLYGLVVKKGSVSYALNLLPQANQIATALWSHLDRPKPIEKRNDWFNFAINHHVGKLAIFWLSGFSLWRKQQDPKPTTLSDEYHRALSDIVGDQALPGKLGRTILMSEFPFLLAVDETWTRENLLPLFKADSDDFQAAWDGFLSRVVGDFNRVLDFNHAVAKAMDKPSRKAAKQIDSLLSGQRNRFIKYYIYMLVNFAKDPLCKWIPKLLRYGSKETKDCFASEVGIHLYYMDEPEQQDNSEQQKKWWQHWLKRYWENRLQGVPAVLESSEVERMLDWLLHLTSVFSEAVDLAVQMPQTPLENCGVIYELSDSDLLQNHPQAVGKLLIYLWKCNLPRYCWHSVQEIVDALLLSDISSELKQELEEIKVQL